MNKKNQGVKVAAEPVELRVTEGIAGTWRYHLSHSDSMTKGLCGARTMLTHIPLKTWGHRGHLTERYCAECEALGKATLEAAGALLGSPATS